MDRKEAADLLDNLIGMVEDSHGADYDTALKMGIEALSAQPEIIRCRDCKHSFLHDNGEKTKRICGLTRMCGTTPDNWFCADAERRTDETD